MIGNVLRPERGPFHLAGILKCRHEILVALALELFLRGTEGGDTGGNLFAFADLALFVLGHIKSPLHVSMCALLNSRTAAAITLSRVNTCIDASDWGVNGEAALQDCDKRRSEKIAAHFAIGKWITASTALSLACDAASAKMNRGGRS